MNGKRELYKTKGSSLYSVCIAWINKLKILQFYLLTASTYSNYGNYIYSKLALEHSYPRSVEGTADYKKS